MPERFFEDIIIKPTLRIKKALNNKYSFICYAKGIKERNVLYYNSIKPTVLGVDHSIDLSWLIKQLPREAVLQGNLDPKVLLQGGKKLYFEVKKIIDLTQERKHIFNVGHGIIKETPLENVEFVLNTLRGNKN